MKVGQSQSDASDTDGSGFWVAPGLVISCAHTVPDESAKAMIGWQGRTYPGTVVERTPPAPGSLLWPYPDLAVVAVEPAPAHPCVWLSETPPAERTPLVLFGHSDSLGEGLRETGVDARLSGWHMLGQGRVWQLKGNEVAPGMSGGPVLDDAAGAVCGVVSSGIVGGDRGGYFMPVAGLRRLSPEVRRRVLHAHDLFHGADDAWTSARAALPALPFPRSPIAPLDEVRFLAYLAERDDLDPTELAEIYHASSAHHRLPAIDLTMLRDVAAALVEDGGLGDGWVVPLMRLAESLKANTRSAPGDRQRDPRELDAWTRRLAERARRSGQLDLLVRSPPARDARPSGTVTVEIAPGSAAPGRYRLSVTATDGEESWPVHADDAAVRSLPEVVTLAGDRVRAAVTQFKGSAFIEFVVPVELFETPFDELAGAKPHTTIGRKHPVVLRDLDRQHDDAVRFDWETRWDAVRRATATTYWAHCADAFDPRVFSAILELSPETAGVAVTRRPSSNAETTEWFRVALDSGVPVAVWRRGACVEHDTGTAGGHCSGQAFHLAFDAVLALTHLRDLPEAVRLIRNQVVTSAEHACQGVTLVWDRPRPDRAGRVAEPSYAPLEEAAR